MNQVDEDTFATALTHCFFCGGPSDIVLNTTFAPKYAKAVKEMDGKVVTKEPCQKCKAWMADGIIMITIREPQPGQTDEDGYYRTGGFYVLKEEAFRRIFDYSEAVDRTLLTRVCFIPNSVAVALGLAEPGALGE